MMNALIEDALWISVVLVLLHWIYAMWRQTVLMVILKWA